MSRKSEAVDRLDDAPDVLAPAESQPRAIEVNGLSKSFTAGSRLPFRGEGRKTVHALCDVSMHVRRGEIYGLVGRNGYGKTTLIKCICSLVEPSAGSVRVLGHDSVRRSDALRRVLGYVSADERSFYFRLSGEQNLMFFARLQGIAHAVARHRIGELAERFEVTALLSRRFYEYSTGNRQRLALVRALMHDPKVLILDEPTRSLDPFAAAGLRRALTAWVAEDRARSVLITSHNLDEVEALSSRVGVMSRGRLREQGSLSELREKFDSRERVRLWLDRSIEAGQLTLEHSAEPPSAGVDPAHGPWVEFRRARRDSLLDAYLQRVAACGAKVLSFERTEMSLQDIIDRVDERANEA